MLIQIFILSKLMEENNYPYKLKKELSKYIPLDKLTNMTESKLYYNFESLSKRGLIHPVEVIKEANRPDKQVFAITDKGRQELPRILYKLFEKADKLQDMLVALIYIRYVDRAQVIEILEKRYRESFSSKNEIIKAYENIQIGGYEQEVVDLFHGFYLGRTENEMYWLGQIIDKLKTQSN
ncbi:MAG: PadR family transcriptional regulator [Solibacillus sp.]|uniref:PadR family transcriptional regulator n=1 Tax=unclassified Solibacillus TaxID=2637870 RepID=UPI0030F8A9A1